MMRRKALAMGAAALAAVPVAISPLDASASDIEDTALQDAFLIWEEELYNTFSVEGVVDALAWPVDVRDYYGQIAFLVEAIGVGGGEVSPGTFSGASGVYTDGTGTQRHGTIYTYAHEVDSIGYSMTDPISVLALHDGVYYAQFSPTYAGSADMPTQWRLTPSASTSSDGTTNYGYSVTRYRYGTQQERIQAQWTLGNGSDVYAGSVGSAYSIFFSFKVSPANISPTWPGIGTAMQGQTPILGAGITLSALPTSVDFPTVTADNVADYIADVLNPTLPEDVLPYVFEPPVPYEPIYPTGETVQGMPKDWTIENPVLPSYNLDLQLPTANFDAVDVSTPLEHHATGLRFWWALLGECLDHFGVKELVIFALALGLIVTILTRLGR